MKWRNHMSGMRAARISEFLWELATDLGLDFRVLDRDKGWIRDAVFFEFEGEEGKILQAKRKIKEAVDRYNND